MVQITLVVDALSTGQFLPSIVIVYLDLSALKLEPEKVTYVPPVTGPNLGFIASSFEVILPTKVT